MNIVIPMAGLGTRFSRCGFTLPKPLIPIAGKPMYHHAVNCLPFHMATNVIFIVRQEEYSQLLIEDIKTNYSFLPSLTLITLDKPTEGQADTILKSHGHLNLKVPTLVHNCDTYIKEHFKWNILLDKEIDGAIVLFPSQESRWSYVQLDKNNRFIIDIQEKKVISNHATTGTYFFKNTAELLLLIQHNIAANLRQDNEFYLSAIYQSMLQLNKKIIPLWVKHMLCFGTPMDLVDSLNYLITELSYDCR